MNNFGVKFKGALMSSIAKPWLKYALGKKINLKIVTFFDTEFRSYFFRWN